MRSLCFGAFSGIVSGAQVLGFGGLIMFNEPALGSSFRVSIVLRFQR